MNILSIYYTHKPGGFCKRLYRLLAALANRGHAVHYLTLDQPPQGFSTSVAVHIIPFPMRKRSGLLFWALFLLWAPLYVLLKTLRHRIDTILAFNPFYSAIAAPASVLLRRPITLFLRSLVFKINILTNKPRWVQGLSNYVDRLGISASHMVVCMTEQMKLELSEFTPVKNKRIEILPNDLPFVDKDILGAEIPEQCFVLLSSGVVDERKNVGLLINACALLQSMKLPDHILIFAGSGPLAQYYKELADSHGLTNIRFLGWQETIAPYLKRAQIVLHPSFHEGMPNSVMEALAYERPVMGSDTPELRELLVHDELLFDPCDASALARRLAAFITDPKLLSPLLLLSRERGLVYSFDWDQRACDIVLNSHTLTSPEEKNDSNSDQEFS